MHGDIKMNTFNNHTFSIILFEFRYKFWVFSDNYRILHKTYSPLYVRHPATLIRVATWGWEPLSYGDRQNKKGWGLGVGGCEEHYTDYKETENFRVLKAPSV
jgi:hypothetical protein